MAPLYDPAREKPQDARACIDQFEFPDIPCAYPVVWVRAREAALLCEAVGKRLCDAHEWEGACAGSLEAPDYRFDLAQGPRPGLRRRVDARRPQPRPRGEQVLELRPRLPEGRLRGVEPEDPGLRRRRMGPLRIEHLPRRLLPRRATARSGVYDLNGNAAEHMNLPLDESQMASRGSRSWASRR